MNHSVGSIVKNRKTGKLAQVLSSADHVRDAGRICVRYLKNGAPHGKVCYGAAKDFERSA